VAPSFDEATKIQIDLFEKNLVRPELHINGFSILVNLIVFLKLKVDAAHLKHYSYHLMKF
jgi:hypothetical protein